MAENCNHNCSECHQTCTDRAQALASMKVAPKEGSHIKHVIGIVSGKGGVGKSLVTSLLACAMNKKGYKTAILDADITGPSIPQAFGIKEKAKSDELGIWPVTTDQGIKVMSINLLLDNITDAVIWRGPMIAGAVRQFWTDVNWGDIDYMFVDMPPGTGDVPLTVYQSLPLDGIILVTSPQQLVAMIVEKAANMSTEMLVPILAMVENMSYFVCPYCKKKYHIFCDSNMKQIADQYGISYTAELPINPELATACDEGAIETIDAPWLEKIVDMLEKE